MFVTWLCLILLTHPCWEQLIHGAQGMPGQNPPMAHQQGCQSTYKRNKTILGSVAPSPFQEAGDVIALWGLCRRLRTE